MEEREESGWSVVRQENERNDQGEGVQNSGTTSTAIRGRDMGVEEGTGKKLEVAEMRTHIRWMCGVTKLDKIRNDRIRGTTKGGKITNKVQERLKWYVEYLDKQSNVMGGPRKIRSRGSWRHIVSKATDA